MQQFGWSPSDVNPEQPDNLLTLPNASALSVGRRVFSFPYSLAKSFSRESLEAHVGLCDRQGVTTAQVVMYLLAYTSDPDT